MRSAEARDTMTARVHQAFADHRTFASWPEAKGKVDVLATVANPNDEKSYVEALYAACALGVPSGRQGNQIVGARVGEDAPQPTGRVLKAGK